MKTDHDPRGLDGVDLRKARRIFRAAPTKLDQIRELRMQLNISAINATKLRRLIRERHEHTLEAKTA